MSKIEFPSDATQNQMAEAFRLLSDLSSVLYHYELSVLLRQYGIDPQRIDQAKIGLAEAMGRRRQANMVIHEDNDEVQHDHSL